MATLTLKKAAVGLGLAVAVGLGGAAVVGAQTADEVPPTTETTPDGGGRDGRNCDEKRGGTDELPTDAGIDV